MFNEFENILGLKFSVESSKDDSTDELVNILVDIREKLRENKNYELADEIRSRLRDIGINLEDK